MLGSRIQILRACKLDDFSEIHHGHSVRDMLHDLQIMGDENISQPHLLLQIHQEIHDLCLVRNI